MQRRDAWAEVGGCIESALCCQHTESIYTVFGHFIKEQIVRVSGTPSTYMIVNGQDLPEPLYHPLWGALNLVNDMDDETDSESSFIDLDSRYSSQPPVSVDYQPFKDGLPPHAISIAAKCALLEEDERALAERQKAAYVLLSTTKRSLILEITTLSNRRFKCRGQVFKSLQTSSSVNLSPTSSRQKTK